MKADTLAKQLLFSTVRIEAASPEKGSVGTGFVFAYESEGIGEGRAAFFMVTNKHVIEDAEEGSFVFIEGDGSGNPLLGRGIKIPILQFEDHWHGHPDPAVDVAVMYLQPLLDHVENPGEPPVRDRTFVAPIRSMHVPTRERLKTYDAVEEITFIGYPEGLYDAANLTPIVRRGITATPMQIDYENKPVFLIDAAVFPGSSGSPVFAASNAIRTDRSGNLTLISSRMAFLGVIAEYLSIEEEGRVEWKPIPTAKKEVPTYKTSQALNLGVVYRSSTVIEAIEDFMKKHGDDSLHEPA